MPNVVQKEFVRHSVLTLGCVAIASIFLIYAGYSWMTEKASNATRLSPISQTAGTAVEESHT